MDLPGKPSLCLQESGAEASYLAAGQRRDPACVYSIHVVGLHACVRHAATVEQLYSPMIHFRLGID